MNCSKAVTVLVWEILACGMVKHASILFYSKVCVAKDVFHVTVKYQLQLKALIYFTVHLHLAEMGDTDLCY